MSSWTERVKERLQEDASINEVKLIALQAAEAADTAMGTIAFLSADAADKLQFEKERADKAGRELAEIKGDAATLRGYIKTYGETPTMTASKLAVANARISELDLELAEVRAATKWWIDSAVTADKSFNARMAELEAKINRMIDKESTRDG